MIASYFKSKFKSILILRETYEVLALDGGARSNGWRRAEDFVAIAGCWIGIAACNNAVMSSACKQLCVKNNIEIQFQEQNWKFSSPI